MGDIWSAVGAVGAFVAAIAASFAGYFTYKIMRAGQEQVRQIIEATRDAQLPLLIPTAPLISQDHPRPNPQGHPGQTVHYGYDYNLPLALVELRNAGPGIALNIRGVIFGPEPDNVTERIPGRLHFHRYQLPLAAGEKVVSSTYDPKVSFDGPWTQGGPPLNGETEIVSDEGRFALYAPHEPGAWELIRGAPVIVARMTLTYSDIFRRKHAAIFDLSPQRH
jgi:hypothetical protein